MQEIVINRKIGGFAVSEELFLKLLDMGIPEIEEEWNTYRELIDDFNDAPVNYSCCYLNRDDHRLVSLVKQMGDAANGSTSKLEVVEVPDLVDWYIYEDEVGMEWVHEKHGVWPNG